jgi:hypothetical protein
MKAGDTVKLIGIPPNLRDDEGLPKADIRVASRSLRSSRNQPRNILPEGTEKEIVNHLEFDLHFCFALSRNVRSDLCLNGQNRRRNAS